MSGGGFCRRSRRSQWWHSLSTKIMGTMKCVPRRGGGECPWHGGGVGSSVDTRYRGVTMTSIFMTKIEPICPAIWTRINVWRWCIHTWWKVYRHLFEGGFLWDNGVLPGFSPVSLQLCHCCKNPPLFPSSPESSHGFVRGGRQHFKHTSRPIPTSYSLGALNNNFQKCSHPEFLLNKKFQNAHTKSYAKLWDKMYSEIWSFFGNPDKCTKARNIISEGDGSVSFELLKRAAEERNARTSERIRDLVARGYHPWQQPECITAHSKRTSERMNGLIAWKSIHVSNLSSLQHTASVPVSKWMDELQKASICFISQSTLKKSLSSWAISGRSTTQSWKHMLGRLG